MEKAAVAMIIARNLLSNPVRFQKWARYGNFLTQMVVTRRCNLACTYCNDYNNSSENVPLTQLKKNVDNLIDLGIFSLELTGGEPLLHPDLIELVRYAKNRGIPRVRMITNGFLLTPGLIRQLNDAELYQLSISVDGVHFNKSTKKSLERLREKLFLLRDTANFSLQLGAVLGSSLPEEAEEIVRFAKKNGFYCNLNLLHDVNGQLCLSPDQLGIFSDLIKEVHGVHYDKRDDFRWRLATGKGANFKCRAGSRYIFVDENSNVTWCSATRTRYSKPLSKYSWDDMKNNFYGKKACSNSCTIGCARRVSRFDAWRDQG